MNHFVHHDILPVDRFLEASMINNFQISPDYNEQAILDRLDKVLDPDWMSWCSSWALLRRLKLKTAI